MDVFVSVPAAALGCYLILFLVFLLSKRSKLKWAFIGIMVPYVCWALGSMCMRIGWFPSVKFWFHFSLLGLFMLPTAILHFTLLYTGEKFTVKHLILALGTIALFVVNLLTDGLFIDAPERVMTGSSAQFVYHFETISVVPYLYLSVLLIAICGILIRAVRRNILTVAEFCLLIMGKIILLLGNVLIICPVFSGFPIDMFCGILDALMLASVLCFSRHFKQTMYVSRTTYRVLVMVSVCLLLICMEGPYEKFLVGLPFFPIIRELIPGITTITFLILNILIFWVNEIITDKVFLKDKEIRAKALDDFNLESCQTLDMKNIQRLVEKATRELLEVDWAVLFIKSMDGNSFCAVSPVGGLWEFPADSCLIQYLYNYGNGKWLNIADAVRKKDMEEDVFDRIMQLHAKQVALVMPIYIENSIHAMLLVPDRKKRYQLDEISYFESLATSCSIAIKNAQLYAAAYWEARTDELTGLGNRKYFYEFMKNLQKGQTVSLILLKLDDFRIYNKLYGSAGGDEILKKVAREIKNKAYSKLPIFRFGATEFSIILCGYDTESAVTLAENIRKAIMGITSGIEKNQMMVTLSGGIYTEDINKQPDISMLDKCDMALYLARKRGKNCTVVYHNSIEEKNDNIVHIKKDIFSGYEPVFRALTAAIDAKDHYTFDHSQNVSYYAVELARAFDLNEENIEIIKEAGLLHDIGKIGIPENILFKPGKLTEEEFKIMKGHVEQSIAMLRHLSGMEYVLPAILGHHERYDGKGYPRGIKGEEIPIAARVLCIADSFDAMMSRRSYKAEYTLEYTIAQLEEGAGTQFDPKLAAAFIELLKTHKLNLRNSQEAVS